MEIAIILALILLNGLLSMSEIALVSVRKTRLETKIKKGSKAAQTALNLSSQPDRFLSTIQIGITLIGILTGLYSGEAFAGDLAVYVKKIPFLESYAFPVSKTIIVILVTYLTLVFGELFPKRIGMSMTDQVAMLVAGPMNFLSKVCAPFVWLLSKSTQAMVKLFRLDQVESNKVTEEEIKAVVREGFDGGEVQEVEQDIVERVFNLGDRNVGSIMTYRSDLISLNIDDSKEEIRRKMLEHLYNSYPVVLDNNLDKIEGMVFLKDIFASIGDPDFTLHKVMYPANFIPETLSVYNSLEMFKKMHVKYGIVTDEFGGVQGIITLKDIMEALIGQVYDIDEDPDIVVRADGSMLIDGQYSFYSFLEHFDMEDLYADNDYNTLSGLILSILEYVPKEGETVTWQNFEFEIVDMDGARIDKILVKKK